MCALCTTTCASEQTCTGARGRGRLLTRVACWTLHTVTEKRGGRIERAHLPYARRGSLTARQRWQAGLYGHRACAYACRAKLASAKAQHEAEFARLLDAGQNPYAVARQRAVQASVRRQQAAIVKALRDGKERITQRLLAEEGTWRRELAAAKKEAAYARKFEKEMGREALEGRVDEYMLSHTREHVAVLDPTSRLPVVPEQDTVTKTWAFGRGGARADVVEKVASQHTPEEAGLIPALLPRKLARAVDKSKGVEWSAQGDEGESRPPGPQRCAPVPLRKPSVMEQRVRSPRKPSLQLLAVLGCSSRCTPSTRHDARTA